MTPLTPTPRTRPQQGGFTLIELLVAMTVTLIITGAMYGLLAGGQNAFRREPELTDRQQSIRMGMDRIQRDVLTAGERLGIDSQVFTQGLDGQGIAGPGGTNTDIVEFIAAPPSCPDMWVDRRDLPQTSGTGVLGSGNSVDVLITRSPPACAEVPGFVVVVHDNGATKPAWAFKVPAGDRINFNPSQQESGSGVDDKDDFTCGQALSIAAAGGCTAPGNPPQKLIAIARVRYLIWPDTDAVPSLWRSDSGGIPSGGGGYVNPPNAAGRWRLIARGVEDLQVQYRIDPANPGNWIADPGLVVAGNTATVVREVRVVLGARTVATNLAGSRTSATGDAVRGQLESIISPRAALFNLAKADVWH